MNGTLHTFEVVNNLRRSSDIWVVFLFGYLGLLQIASLILALMNRKITIKAINDSREIRRIVYITSFAIFEMFILYFVVGNFNDAGLSLFIGHLLAATIIFILLLFVPKVQYCFIGAISYYTITSVAIISFRFVLYNKIFYSSCNKSCPQ